MESKTDRYGNTFFYIYDANGNRKQFRDHDNKVTIYDYDKLNRLKQLTQAGLGAFTWTYDAAGLPKRIDYPNGSAANYLYDNVNRIALIDNTQSGVTVTSHAYEYDLNGNRDKLTESNIDVSQITTYEYDDADRLIKVFYPTKVTSYSLDKVGNRELEVIDSGGVLITRDYGYNNRDQLVTVTDNDGLNLSYNYDAFGNQTEKVENGVTTTFDYTARQRVKSITVGANSPNQYQYDYAGQRVNAQTNGMEKRYLYDGLTLIAETNAIGNTLTTYHYGTRHQLAESRNSINSFYLTDALGTNVAITNQDGSIQNRMDYDVWGNLNQETASSDSPFGFTGYIRDDETDLYYANARYYDSFTGRFLREDPLEGDVNTPPSLHRYLYANGNPTYFVDPDGRLAEAGHFYIPLYIALRAGMGKIKSQRFAFFTQLLDEIDDLDATSVMLDTLVNVGDESLIAGLPPQQDLFNATTNSELYEKMILVQSVFHGITGNNSDDEKELTLDLISLTDNPDLKALFAHRLGDQAHQDFNTVEGRAINLPTQFVTGIGHGFKGHLPDSLHFREDITFTYIEELAEIIAGVQGMNAEETKVFKAEIVEELSVLKGISKIEANPNNPFKNRKPGFRERASLNDVLPTNVKSLEQMEQEDIMLLKQLIRKQGLYVEYSPEKYPGTGALKSYTPGLRVQSFDQAANRFTRITGIAITGDEIKELALQAVDMWKKETNYKNGEAAVMTESNDNSIDFSIEGY